MATVTVRRATYDAEGAAGEVIGCAVVGERVGGPFLGKLHVVPTAHCSGADREVRVTRTLR